MTQRRGYHTETTSYTDPLDLQRNDCADAFTDEQVERYKQAFSRPGSMTAALNYYRASEAGAFGFVQQRDKGCVMERGVTSHVPHGSIQWTTGRPRSRSIRLVSFAARCLVGMLGGLLIADCPKSRQWLLTPRPRWIRPPHKCVISARTPLRSFANIVTPLAQAGRKAADAGAGAVGRRRSGAEPGAAEGHRGRRRSAAGARPGRLQPLDSAGQVRATIIDIDRQSLLHTAFVQCTLGQPATQRGRLHITTGLWSTRRIAYHLVIFKARCGRLAKESRRHLSGQHAQHLLAHAPWGPPLILNSSVCRPDEVTARMKSFLAATA